MQYPATIKIVQVPCTGRVDVLLILRAIEEGVDGVMVAGCLPGDCHFLEGNTNAKRRVQHVQKLLAEIGLEKERVQMFNLSSAMAGQFVTIAQQMHDCIRSLGQSPLRKLNQEQEDPEGFGKEGVRG